MNKKLFILAYIISLNAFSEAKKIELAKGNISTFNNISVVKHRDVETTYYVYVHGLGGRGINCFQWSHIGVINDLAPSKNFILYDPLVFFDFPDVCPKLFNPSKTDLGQTTELSYLKQNFKDLLSIIEPESKIVISGVSRGAAIIINLMNMLEEEEQNRIAMLILESPFDHVLNVIKNVIGKMYQDWNPFMQITASWSFQKLFPNVDINGPAPIDNVIKIPKHIPVIFIHSLKDKLININSSRRLYSRLIQNGHEHAYYLELEDGEHARLLWQNHGPTYQAIIHALYQKYNLEHDLELATKGKNHLHKCQPSDHYIQQLIKKTRF
ncbi:alpha/beta hydrolase [Candidatus Dependentiae bacterium]|nr:alpha/beta hydrolase [Candidatus Dependentiae bacterium]